MAPEVGIVEALADQLHEGVDGDERVLDLVGDARDDAGQEVELLRLLLLGGQLLLGGEVFQDEHRARRFVAAHRIGRHFQP